MLSFGFYDSKDGDRKYNAAKFSGLFDGILYDGVFREIGDCFRVTADADNPGMKLYIGTGRAWFNRTWTYNSTPYAITIDAPDSQRRIDRIVLEVNKTKDVRANSFKVIKGTPAASSEEPPVIPEMSTEKNVYQYPIADIYVNPDTTELTEDNINRTVGTFPCPYARGLHEKHDPVPRNNQANVAEMLGVAQSYYAVRGTSEDPTFRYGYTTCLEENYTPYNPDDYETDELSRQIDCSTFIGLILRGIPFRKSPYHTIPSQYVNPGDDEPEEGASGGNSSSDERSKRPGYLPANAADYAWAVNPGDFTLPTTPLAKEDPVRTASQLAEWMELHGRAIELRPDFANVEPGDIIFWAKTDADGKYVRNYRYRNISHVAVCYSKLPQPEDATIGSKVNVVLNSFAAEEALDWLEHNPRKVKENTVYQVYREANGTKWVIRKRSNEIDPTTQDYTWQYLHEATWTDDLTLTEDPVSLPLLGIDVSIVDATQDASFRLTQYYWERDKYPYKHTMMEVTSVNPVVLNRTLEKIRPEEVVLICRPDLGAVVNDKFAGNMNTTFGRTEIDTLYREGLYYLTSDISFTYKGQTITGRYKALEVKKTQTKHGKTYSLTQIIWDTNNFGGYLVRTQYCYAHQPNSTDWSEFRWFPATMDIQYSGIGNNTSCDHIFSEIAAAYAAGCKLNITYRRNNDIYEMSSKLSVNSDGELTGIDATYFRPSIDSGTVRRYVAVYVTHTSSGKKATFESED